MKYYILFICFGGLLVASKVTLGSEGRVADEAFPQEEKRLLDLGYSLSGDGLFYLPFEPVNATEITTGKTTKQEHKSAEVKKKETKRTSVGGTYLGVWRLSRYYSCDKQQTKRLSFEKGNMRSYKACMRRQFLGDGDPRTTADETYLTNEKHANKTVACPRKYMGKTLIIEGYGEYLCNDVGGAIKGHRLDVYAGIGDHAIDIRNTVPTGNKKIYLK